VSNARKFRRRLAIVPPLTEDQPPRIREGAARRRLTVTTGRCPCGARLVMPKLRAGDVVRIVVEHEPGCPATEAKPASDIIVRAADG